MLPEIADFSATEAAIGARFARRGGNQKREVFFDVSLDSGASAFEAKKAQQFIGDELVIGRALEGQESVKKVENLWGPGLAMIPTAGARDERLMLLQTSSSQLIETGPANTKERGGRGGVKQPVVEIINDAKNKTGWKAMDDLFLFKMGLTPRRGRAGDGQLLSKFRENGIKNRERKKADPASAYGLLRVCLFAQVNR